MKEFFKHFREALKGNEGTSEEVDDNEKPITNQELEDKIFEVYKQRFKVKSTKQTMLFPTCFRVFLHPIDFAELQDSFDVIARDIANDFCAFNREKMYAYKYHKPHATNWLFQFVEFKEGDMVGHIDSLQMGEINIISTLYSQDFSKNRDNISNERGITATKSHKNSTNQRQLNNYNINAFLGMDMLDGNRFAIRINDSYDEVLLIPKSEDQTQMYESDIIATLVCDKNFFSGSKTGHQYNITTNYIEISGKRETRTGANIVKIDYLLPDSIVHLKYDNGKFYLAAFGKVRLHESIVPISKGGALHWVELSDSSRMLIMDDVSIEFKRKIK